MKPKSGSLQSSSAGLFSLISFAIDPSSGVVEAKSSSISDLILNGKELPFELFLYTDLTFEMYRPGAGRAQE
jgi:hypothetical protein